MASLLHVIPPLPGPNPAPYRVASLYMFDTCTHKCGYCWLAESGNVLEFSQLECFRDPVYLDKVTSFFLKRTSASHKWLLQMTGGEPLMTPNLDRLTLPLIEAGNRLAFYTALLVGRDHPGYRFMLSQPHPAVDYVLASFHPEAELNEPAYFDKIRQLKDAGHKVILRFVGHPQRLHRLQELSDKCSELDVCFLPAALYSKRYPGAYTPAEKQALLSHSSSLSQLVQLEGGFDTTGLMCYGGSRIIGVNMQTGNITTCITVHQPPIGNILEDRLELNLAPILCPEPGIACLCEVHMQQNIVIGAENRETFERQANGFTPPASFDAQLDALAQNGVRFHTSSTKGVGDVTDDSRLFYTIAEIRENYRTAHYLPRTSLPADNLESIIDLRGSFERAGETSIVEHAELTRIVTQVDPWSYAARAQFSTPPDLAGELWVRFRLTVVRGSVGIGVLSRTTDYQDRAFLSAAPQEQKCYLRITGARDFQGLIIQNSGAEGPTEILLREAVVLGPPNREHGMLEFSELREALLPVNAGDIVEHGASTRVVTAPAAWSYAARAPLDLPSDGAAELWLQLRVQVTRGQAAFGILDRSGARYLDRAFLAEAPYASTLFLRIAEPANARDLIVQNGALDGQPAEILLHRATVLAGVTPPESVPAFSILPS